ncbi:hypothetical protein [Nocardiopsis sp. MG754419]|uniref:hypothetical protein n=1 Tax=Nocardiopsis sp. MG754419 TaxID=2259865 RepID=UPI001BAE4BE5|nr:hypothetical protein [Nocardiopsis sp. MG754419]MBR8741434.1 hypothetical protein [Nocardiopsis sp. MG754419]
MTSLATAMAAAWPSGPVTVPVLVEADASGGDVAAWHGMETASSGLVSLAAASRSPLPAGSSVTLPSPENTGTGGHHPVLRHAVELSGGLQVVAAPSDPLKAGRAVEALARHPRLLKSGRVTVVDVGRAVPGSAGAALLCHADITVVVVEAGRVDQAERLRVCAPVLASLRQDGVRVGLAITGACPYPEAEISQIAGGLPVWARIPWDLSGAALVRGEHHPPQRIRDRLAAWHAHRRDPDSLEWMPLISAAKALAELCDDFDGLGLGVGQTRTLEVRAA